MTVKHCWPTHWLEAAMSAGLATYKGNGEWAFINDELRDMLERFGTALQDAERERWRAAALLAFDALALDVGAEQVQREADALRELGALISKSAP